MELRMPDYWDFSINSIEYSESEQVDNYVPVPYISRLGVEEGHISLYWGIDSWDMVSAVRVYREGSTSGSWNMVQEYASGPVSPILQQHIDYTSAPATRAYRYEVRSVNSEGVEFASTQHRSIHLTINKGIQNQWNLMWNAYEGRDVEAVTIYRGSDAASLEAIDQIAGNSYSYTDVSAPEGDVYYQIETHFIAQSKSKETGESSRSNIATNVESAYYTLQILPSENGQVRVSREGQEVLSGSVFEEGTRLDMEATADPGFRFGQWMDGNTENPGGFQPRKSQGSKLGTLPEPGQGYPPCFLGLQTAVRGNPQPARQGPFPFRRQGTHGDPVVGPSCRDIRLPLCHAGGTILGQDSQVLSGFGKKYVP